MAAWPVGQEGPEPVQGHGWAVGFYMASGDSLELFLPE